MDMLDVAREIKEIIMLGMSNIYIYVCVPGNALCTCVIVY